MTTCRFRSCLASRMGCATLLISLGFAPGFLTRFVPLGERLAPRLLAQDARAGESALPPGVYARVDGRDVTEREYAEFLLASVGKSQLGTYIDRLLIEGAARSQGVIVTSEEVEALVEERVQRAIRGLYRGEEAAWTAALAARQTSPDEERARHRHEIYYQRLLEKLVLKSREITPARVQSEFESQFGPGGVQHEVRHILISTRRRTGADGESLPARTEAEALERAGKIRDELLAGADFGQLVKRYSDDSFTRANDGRIPLYRADFYGDEFHRAVEALTPERPLSGIVRSRRGLHVVELVDRRKTRLEDVRAQVEELARNRPPTPAETESFLSSLRDRAKIVR